MTITAKYEDGVFKPLEDVTINEGTIVEVRVPSYADRLYVDGAAAGVIEAKKEGATLTGFEDQSFKYSEGLPDSLPTYRRPLPFCYQTTGVETRFTNLLEPDARSRPASSFHRPETFAGWLTEESRSPGSTLRGRLQRMPCSLPATCGSPRSAPFEVSNGPSPKAAPAPSSKWPPAPAKPLPPATSPIA